MTRELIDVLAPVYLVVGLGWWWARTGRRYDTVLITELIMTVGAPCLVFSSLTGLAVERDALVAMAGAVLVAFAVFWVVGEAVLRAAGLAREVYLGPVVFMNVGNLGLPGCFYAFGEAGLSLAVVFFAIGALGQFTVGLTLWSGRLHPGDLMRTPLAWAAVLSTLTLASGLAVPAWLARTTAVLGGFTIPLMQFTLGVSLGRLGLGSLGRAAGISLLRLGLGLAAGVGLAWLFGLTGVTRQVFILDCAMPVAVFNYLLAQRYGRAPGEVAGIVVVSTLLAFVTLPLLLAWLA